MLDDEAIIYLSENRKCFQTETFRSFEIIDDTDLKLPINSIIKFSDNTLTAQSFQQILSDSFISVVLIPLVGAIEVFDKTKTEIVNAGESAYFSLRPNEHLSVQNPYRDDLINYLEIWIKRDSFVEHDRGVGKLDLEKNKNQLVDISHACFPEKVFIGKYGGRKEGNLFLENQAFVFVINGAFECQSRLIESRSALLLRNIDELEFEGLAQENIILIFQMSA